MKPLILPFKTPLGYYFYETQRNEIVAVNNELYNHIKMIMDEQQENIPNTNQIAEMQFNELVSFGYMAPPHIKNLEHPATGILDVLLERKVDRVLLQVTQRCNLRCQYCVYSEVKNPNTRSHAANAMNFQTAKKAIDFYAKHSIDEEEKAIGFYGGEPLLEFELIKKIINYANELFEGKDIIYSITTNGTLLNDDIIEFFVKNDMNITISLDGPKLIHDKNRKFANGKGSFDIVLQNLVKLKERSTKKIPFGINMVIDPDNDYEETIKLFEHPVMEGVNISTALVEEDGISKAFNSNYYTKFEYDLFLGIVNYFRGKNLKSSNMLIQQELEQMMDGVNRFKKSLLFDTAAPSGPCIPGKMRLFIDCFGNLFPCERVSETNPNMKIGTLDTGFDVHQANELLNISKLTEADCKECWAFSLCSACGKYAESNNSLCATKRLAYCSKSRNMAFLKILGKTLEYENGKHERKICSVKERTV